MNYYHLEPLKGFAHVLRAYTDVNHFVEVELLKNNAPLDCSDVSEVIVRAGECYLCDDAIDLSYIDKGILRLSFKGVPVGSYHVPVTLSFNDQPDIVFTGGVTVFVADTSSDEEVTTFYPVDVTEDVEDTETSEVTGEVEGNEAESDTGAGLGTALDVDAQS